MGRVDIDASGRKLPMKTRLQMLRLRKWLICSRVHSSTERNLAHAMSELDRLSDKLSIRRSVKENAALIYRKALEKDLIRGRTIPAIVAAALYAACRKSETPKTLGEIAEASLVTKKNVASSYRLLFRKLDIQMPIANPITCISKIGERVSITGQTQGLAIRILREAKKRRIASGKDPMGLAAAALYIACLQSNEKKMQKDIAEAAGVTEVTIRNRYKSPKTPAWFGAVRNHFLACSFAGSNTKEVTLKARGQVISTAVDAVEITRHRFMKDLSIGKITIGTEEMLRVRTKMPQINL